MPTCRPSLFRSVWGWQQFLSWTCSSPVRKPYSLSIAVPIKYFATSSLPSRVGRVSTFFFATFPFDYTRLDKQYQRTVTCVPRWNSWVTSPLPPLCSPRVPAIGGSLQQRRGKGDQITRLPLFKVERSLPQSNEWRPLFSSQDSHAAVIESWAEKGMLTLHWQAYGCRKKIFFFARRLFPSAFTMQHHTLHA